jgi:hypothetical protein
MSDEQNNGTSLPAEEEESQTGRRGVERVFETEDAFLAAQAQFHHANRGFVVSKGTRQFWVYAMSRDHAIGLVARRLKLLDCATYERARAVRNMPENEVLAIFNSLPPELQQKVRKHLAKNSKKS